MARSAVRFPHRGLLPRQRIRGQERAGLWPDVGRAAGLLEETLHELKHDRDGAIKLQRELAGALAAGDWSGELRTALVDAERSVGNNLGRMDYAVNRALALPIGSGVIEAACKHVVKQRVACSGMKWKRKGLQAVLTLRPLCQSSGHTRGDHLARAGQGGVEHGTARLEGQ